MRKPTLEISRQVEKGRYISGSRKSEVANRIVMIGYEDCSIDYKIERNGFPFWTFEFVMGGRGNVQLNGQEHALHHGALFVYGPGVQLRIANASDQSLQKYFFVSGSRVFPEAWRSSGLTPGQFVQLGNTASVVRVFDQMLDESKCRDASTNAILQGLERVLYALIFRYRGKLIGDPSGSRAVYDSVMNLLQSEYRSLNALSDLAERSGYTSEYICRLFRKYQGASPYQVLMHRKMSAAWLLLRDGQLSVGAVGAEVGYEDPLHFSRTFKKVMGCAPSSVQTDGTN